MIKRPTFHLPGMAKRISHPAMMGNGTEEQNLTERGDPAPRIKSEEAAATLVETEKTKP